MMAPQRCLVCAKPIESGDGATGALYHPPCCKQLFGTTSPPDLSSITASHWEDLALQNLNQRLALPGVQKKLSLALEHKTHAKPRLTVVGALGGDFILKPPNPLYPHMPELEHATLGLAQLCGLETAVSGLIPTDQGELAFITRRFDRFGKRKLALEDFCQLLELPTSHKYKSTYERLGRGILTYSHNPGNDALTYFELLVFCFLTGNGDMHLKNFSLLSKNPGVYVLAPAYDLVPTRLLIPEKEDPEDVALHLNGKKRKLNSGDFLHLAHALQLPHKVALGVLRRYVEKVGPMTEFLDAAVLPPEVAKGYKTLVSQRAGVFGKAHL